jgi:TonB-dependent receptor
MPSPEPLQRAVPLDMFDTSIVKDVLVQKTHSANYGLEFSGGAVDIRSAALPNESFFKIKASSSYNSISTGKTGLHSGGESDDWLGKDDGGRKLPSEIKQYQNLYPNIFEQATDIESPQEDIARLSFTNNDWEAKSSSNPYDYGLSLGGGMRFEINDRISAGFVAVASLKNKWRNRSTERTEYNVENALEKLGPLHQNIDRIRQEAIYKQTESDPTTGSFEGLFEEIYDQERTQRTINRSTLLSLGIEIDWRHTFTLTNLITRKTTDTVQEEAKSVFTTDKSYSRDTLIDWAENEIDLKQFNAEHVFDVATINWRVAKVDATRDNLDSKEFSLESQGAGDEFDLDNQGKRPFRSFSFLDDETTDFGIDIEVPLYHTLFPEATLKFGASQTKQEREFQGLVFEYVLRNFAGSNDPVLDLPLSVLLDSSACVVGTDPAPPTVNTECFLATNFDGNSLNNPPTGAITISDGTDSREEDFYSGEATVEAYYAIVDMQLRETLRVSAGIRNERSLLEVKDSDGQLFNDNPLLPPSQLKSTDQLTSMSITWDFYENMILRAAYSQTVNRPILRELAPITLFSPEDGRFYRGNSNLQTAEIENFDIRYEMYFGEDDYFSVSAFKKRISSPIELFAAEGAIAETLVYSWENSELAVNEGFEFEVRKYFSPYIYLSSNATFMDSDVTDTEIITRTLERSNVSSRALTGASEKIFNSQLVYDGDALQASLAYNRYSERIDSLVQGIASNTIALVVEEPFASVDANIKYKLFLQSGEAVIGFKATNLLDESITRNVENLDGLPFEEYDVGQTYSLSLEWKQ